MVVNANISAVNSNRVLANNLVASDKTMEKLSSGKRINSAADDAAGLAVSRLMDGKIRGLEQASRNVQDSISLAQTAEGYLNEVQNNVIRLQELAVQSANGTYNDGQRQLIQTEVNQIMDEIDRVSGQAEFNGLKLLASNAGAADGAAKPVVYATPEDAAAVGIPTSQPIRVPSVLDAGQDGTGPEKSFTLKTHVGAMKDEGTGMHIFAVSSTILFGAPAEGSKDGALDLTTPAAANTALEKIAKANESISAQRANIGAYQNRLESTLRTSELAHQNLLASSSRIQDANMAQEVSDNVKNNILSQVSRAMLAQSNARNNSVLQLLQ